MKISKFNDKGYPDPTAYEALTAIEHERQETRKSTQPAYRPLVYICSPYADDILNNERKARRYCRFAIRENTIPVASHLLYPQMLDENDPEERQLGLLFGLVLLSKCEECWVFGNRISPGMAQEIGKARRRGIPVRYFTEDMEEVEACD